LRDASLPDDPSGGPDLAHNACQTDPDLALVHAPRTGWLKPSAPAWWRWSRLPRGNS
jgi:hypothetical protein